MTVACVTGASGFIGGALVRRLAERGQEVLPAHRGEAARGISDLARRSEADLARMLAGVDAVYHLAGLHEGSRHATAADFDAVNRDLTLRLFNAACAAGVRTFVWLSTIKVLGEVAAEPLGPEAPYAPVGGYAQSKTRAERALLDAGGHATALAVVRPPLVYGPGVRGNFAALMRLCWTGLPLPLAGATALRSMVGLDNLVDFLALLPAVDLNGAKILHVRDGEEWRVTDLAGELQRLSGHSSRQFPMSRKLADSFAGWLGMQGAVSRLFDPLRVDAESSERRVGWKPPRPSAELLEETVAWTRLKR